jgi:signal peptidase I
VKTVFKEYGQAILVALMLALLIRSFVVQAFKIPSGSMLQTLQIGDHILVNKFVYGVRIPFTSHEILSLGEPKRGDVIVFVYPKDTNKDFIKRVVGEPGDVVEVHDKVLFVNGRRVADSYAQFVDGPFGNGESPRDNFDPFTIPDGTVFVMGDNRDRSYDSRFWGPVEIDKIKGKAFLIYWSWDRQHHWPRFDRIGDLIY